MGGWWRLALVSLDGLAPSQMVSVYASVNLPLHHQVQKFSSGTGSPRWSRKKGCKTVVVVTARYQLKTASYTYTHVHLVTTMRLTQLQFHQKL